MTHECLTPTVNTFARLSDLLPGLCYCPGGLVVFHVRATDRRLVAFAFWKLPAKDSPLHNADRPYTGVHMPLNLTFRLETKQSSSYSSVPVDLATGSLAGTFPEGAPRSLVLSAPQTLTRDPAACSAPGQTSRPKASLKTLRVWKTEDELVRTTTVLSLPKLNPLCVEIHVTEAWDFER